MALSLATMKRIDAAVAVFERDREKFLVDASNLENRLLSNPDLKKLIHSSKSRAKDPSHLRDKLIRRAEEAIGTGKPFDVTAATVYDKIVDLAGVRLLHLHTRQMVTLHPLLIKVLTNEGYVLKGRKQEAKTWDPEYAGMLKELGLKVAINPSLYTSVHYIVKQNKTTARLCELQVRTLAEEIWGEISHTINYPQETDSVACKEQISVLARLVSGCSRLVDSIVTSYEDHCSRRTAAQKSQSRRRR